MKYEVYQGETQGFKIKVKNEPEDANVVLALVYGNHLIAKSFSKLERTLFKEGDYYICELSTTDTKALGASNYVLEIKVESASGAIIRQVGEVVIKRNQVFKI